MKKFNILIAGCGDVGTATAKLLAKNHRVYGLRRSTKTLANDITAIQADLSKPETLSQLPDIDIVIYCAAPSNSTQENRISNYRQTYLTGLSNLLAALKKPAKHLFFTSSTSVYHQHEHQWVDEKSSTQPQSETARIMLLAEQQVSCDSASAATIVRFGGIYSANRLHFFKRVAAGQSYDANPIQYSNRIHLDDCAGILSHLVNKLANNVAIAPLYLACDNSPAPLSEVSQWITQQLQVTPSSVAPSRNTGSKRCNNRLIIESGYRFIYPSFKEGYRDAVQQHLQMENIESL
ncbi:SDR family oxidoreductase [Gammaproteobacteria bacterium AS21]